VSVIYTVTDRFVKKISAVIRNGLYMGSRDVKRPVTGWMNRSQATKSRNSVRRSQIFYPKIRVFRKNILQVLLQPIIANYWQCKKMFRDFVAWLCHSFILTPDVSRPGYPYIIRSGLQH
jgi:hypothetical protein